MAAAGKRGLTRARVVNAAVVLADRDGLGAVSMRRVAAELGVAPMALYKHVRDKEDLLDGMVDQVISEFAPVPRRLPWREQVRARLLSARSVVTWHTWARAAIESRTRRTPTVLGHLEAITTALLEGGFSPELTHHVMHAIGNRVWGFSPEMFNGPGHASDQASDGRDLAEFAEQFPNIVVVARAATAEDPAHLLAGCDEEYEFTFALDLLLDAADQLRRYSPAWSA